MPPPEEAGLVEDAVLWPVVGRNSRNEILVGAPVALLVRWLHSEGQPVGARFSSSVGQQHRSVGGSSPEDALVVVDREVAVDSIMWRGRLEDWAPGNPGLLQVAGYRQTPDTRAREFYRVLALKRYKDALPPSA